MVSLAELRSLGFSSGWYSLVCCITPSLSRCSSIMKPVYIQTKMMEIRTKLKMCHHEIINASVLLALNNSYVTCANDYELLFTMFM